MLALDTSRPFVSSSPSNGLETEKEGWIARNPNSDFYGDGKFSLPNNSGYANLFGCLSYVCMRIDIRRMIHAGKRLHTLIHKFVNWCWVVLI